MDRDQLIARHPRLYHIADARNWDSILACGLLSTSSLLDRFEVGGASRDALESGHRPRTEAIPPAGPHPAHGLAFVRDQRPLQPGPLAGCLEGMTVEQWLRLLNGRVFFWPTTERRDGMLRAYRKSEQAVFEVDARGLLERHGDRVELCHINSGYASSAYPPARRGRDSFLPIERYKDAASNRIAEVTVPGSVPDIFEVTIRVATWLEGKEVGTLWEP